MGRITFITLCLGLAACGGEGFQTGGEDGGAVLGELTPDAHAAPEAGREPDAAPPAEDALTSPRLDGGTAERRDAAEAGALDASERLADAGPLPEPDAAPVSTDAAPPVCAGGLHACKGQCSDLTSPEDCGVCGRACTTSIAHASPTCDGSSYACRFACDAGYRYCAFDSTCKTPSDYDAGCGS